MSYQDQQYAYQNQQMVPQQYSRQAIPLGIDKPSIQKMKDQFAMALPSFYTADRFARACYNVLNPKNQKDANTVAAIKRTTPESFFGCLLACASLGLEPNGPLGHAYIIPYGNTCNLVLGYKGLIDLARRSGDVQAIVAHEVCQNDDFKFDFGTGELPSHTFDLTKPRGNMIAVYAIAKFKDGSYHFDLMTKAEVDQIRNLSKAKNSTPWAEHYVEMAKKTVIRRIAKYLPMDVQKAAAYDGASLKYDAKSDETSGLVFAGYDEEDESENVESLSLEQQAQTSEIPPTVVTSTKAVAAAESIKASSAKRKPKSAEPTPPSVQTDKYSVTASDIGNDASELEEAAQFQALAKEVDTLVACGKMDPEERQTARQYLLEAAGKKGIELSLDAPF